MCFLIGQIYCLRSRNNLSQLKECRKAFILLEREITVKLSDLSRALENVARRCDEEEIRELFEQLAIGLSDDIPFSQVLENCIRKCIRKNSIGFSPELINSLISAGKGLGYQDIESNSNMIRLIVSELEEYIASESDQMSDRIKVYRTISVAAGLGLAIILI